MAVELSDYMRRVLRWSWLIAVVTVVGGVIALLLTSQSSTAYVTSATVSPPADVTTATQAQQYVNDFQAAAGSRAVQDAVNVETDVPRSTIGDRVTVNRVGDSGLVSVSYQSPLNNDPKAEAVVESVVQNTLSLMYDTRVKAAERTVDGRRRRPSRRRRTRQTAAEGQVSAFLAARDYVSPADELASVQDQITQFQVRETEVEGCWQRRRRQHLHGPARRAGAAPLRPGPRTPRPTPPCSTQVDQAKQQVGRAQEAKEGAARNVAEIKPEGNTRFAKRNEAQDRAATHLAAHAGRDAGLLRAQRPAGGLAGQPHPGRAELRPRPRRPTRRRAPWAPGPRKAPATRYRSHRSRSSVPSRPTSSPSTWSRPNRSRSSWSRP